MAARRRAAPCWPRSPCTTSSTGTGVPGPDAGGLPLAGVLAAAGPAPMASLRADRGVGGMPRRWPSRPARCARSRTSASAPTAAARLAGARAAATTRPWSSSIGRWSSTSARLRPPPPRCCAGPTSRWRSADAPMRWPRRAGLRLEPCTAEAWRSAASSSATAAPDGAGAPPCSATASTSAVTARSTRRSGPRPRALLGADVDHELRRRAGPRPEPVERHDDSRRRRPRGQRPGRGAEPAGVHRSSSGRPSGGSC